MWTIQVNNDNAKVWYNDNGEKISNTFTHIQIRDVSLACNNQTDPDTCVELRASFASHSDYESVPFTVINESDYTFDGMDAINAVACLYFRNFKEE